MSGIQKAERLLIDESSGDGEWLTWDQKAQENLK